MSDLTLPQASPSTTPTGRRSAPRGAGVAKVFEALCFSAATFLLVALGGLLVSQLLTLYITPVYYVYIERLRLRLARKRPHVETRRDVHDVQGAPAA